MILWVKTITHIGDGKMVKKNSRIRNVFEPVFQLAHYWKMGKVSNLNTTVSYQQGSDARSRLDWFHAQIPTLLITENYQAMEYTVDEFELMQKIDWGLFISI